MQTTIIKNTKAALLYAWFLQDRGIKVEYLIYREGKGVLKTDMHPCKLPARCDTTNPEEVGEKCRS